MTELWGWPISTWLVLAWFALACIDTHNKRIWQAAKHGQLPEGDRQPPGWLALLVFLQYAVFAYLLYLNWRQALSVWILTFIAAVVISPVLEMIGALLLIPVALVTYRSE